MGARSLVVGVGFRALPGLLFLMFLTLSPTKDVSAHSMTFVSTSLQQVCVASGASDVPTFVYDSQTPGDKTWSTRLQVFLANGDRYQDARFNAVLYNNAIVGDDVADFMHAARDWISAGNAHFSQTMSGHIGGTFTLKVYLTNPDFFSQCFWLWGDAGYQ